MSLKPILLWVEAYQREREGTPDTAGHLLSRPRGDSGCRDITGLPGTYKLTLEVNLRVVRDTSVTDQQSCSQRTPSTPLQPPPVLFESAQRGREPGLSRAPVHRCKRTARPLSVVFFVCGRKLKPKRFKQLLLITGPRPDHSLYCSRSATQVRATLVAMFHRSLFCCHLRLRVITHSGRDRCEHSFIFERHKTLM